MKKGIISLSCFLFFIGQSWAQEKVFLKNQKEPINCQVIEINSSEIKYKPDDAEQLVIGVSKLEVDKIVFKSGRVQYFTDPLEDFNFYKNQKRWNLKVGILSPASGYTDFYLEKSVKPGRSVEYQATIIGLGVNPVIQNQYNNSTNQEYHFDQKGGSIGVGLKVLRMPDFELANRKLMHILQGGYLKPAISLGYYQRSIVFTDPINYVTQSQTKGIVTSLISMSVGKQWILDNTFSIDLYATIGLGIDNYRRQQAKTYRDVTGFAIENYNDVIPYRNFGYTRFGRGDAGVAIGAGVKIGYLFNVKKKKSANGLDKMRERLNK
jgi:hypothetical protein